MKIFILDDVWDRHAFFKKHLANKHQLFHAQTDQEALALLLTQEFDFCFFDHDLNLFKTINSKVSEVAKKTIEITGSDIAGQFLYQTTLSLPKQVIVHSSNYQGAMNIISKFKSANVQADYLPFGSVELINFISQL